MGIHLRYLQFASINTPLIHEAKGFTVAIISIHLYFSSNPYYLGGIKGEKPSKLQRALKMVVYTYSK